MCILCWQTMISHFSAWPLWIVICISASAGALVGGLSPFFPKLATLPPDFYLKNSPFGVCWRPVSWYIMLLKHFFISNIAPQSKNVHSERGGKWLCTWFWGQDGYDQRQGNWNGGLISDVALGNRLLASRTQICSQIWCMNCITQNILEKLIKSYTYLRF